MTSSDEPMSEATLSLYLRKLVQAEIDRSFKLGLTGTHAPDSENAGPDDPPSESGRLGRGQS